MNRLIHAYRIVTYDYFPFEVSPWDVPVWFVDIAGQSVRVVLGGEYATWDEKPVMVAPDRTRTQYQLADPGVVDAALRTEPNPGELELQDALNLMERGDYSGAVRRITTALEVVVEAALRTELMNLHPAAEVERRLVASQNDFPGRCRQYYRLSGRGPEAWINQTLSMVRDLRHEIVHRGLRISYPDRGRAQMCVDQGRWVYNWFEDDPQRRDLRERRIALRSLGRHLPWVEAELTQEGIRFW